MKLVTITVIRSLICCAALAAAAWGQTKEFDVVSIKPHKGDDGRVGIQMAPGGLLRATNVPLRELIQIAFDLRPGQMAGAPKWVDTERYDIEAKMAEPPPAGGGPDVLRPYMESLLLSRFQLKFHREPREMQVYNLVVGKGGPKLKESDAAARGPMVRMGRDQLTFTKCDTAMVARQLSRVVGTMVTDQTGLKGQYDMELKFTPEGPSGPGGPEGGGSGPGPGSDAPGIFTAVQEQLGLKLEAKKGPVNVLVIDKIEKPEEN